MGSNRGLIIAIAAAAVLVLVGGIIAALVVAVDAVDDEPPVTATEREDPTRPAGGERNDPSDVALEEMLTLIDESERTMLRFQETVAFAPDVDAVEDAAAEAAESLGRIKGELLGIDVVGSYDDALRTVLDSYVAHLEAWETYAAATAETAQAYLDETGEYLQAINDTADVFLRAMEQELPDDIPQDLFDFAQRILDRGFRGADAPNGTLV
ncbi:MAG: hypothetical protein R3249_04115 [Nitriliruptorales bacterium]|nr:hypothetical protein [Nitriliruptorales bacterium]